MNIARIYSAHNECSTSAGMHSHPSGMAGSTAIWLPLRAHARANREETKEGGGEKEEKA